MNIYEIFNFIKANVCNWDAMEYNIVREKPTFDLYFITSMDTYDVYRTLKTKYPNATIIKETDCCVTLDTGYEVINLDLL